MAEIPRNHKVKFFMVLFNMVFMVVTMLVFVVTIDVLAQGASGIYLRSLGTTQDFIMIFPDEYSSADELMAVSAHEIGHWYWYERLTDEQRQEWNSSYEQTMKLGYPFVSGGGRYGSTSVEEDFAEMFRVSYLSEANYFRVYPYGQSRADWFRDNVYADANRILE